MKWRVVLESNSETGDWAVWCPELPGYVSAGETEQEALENIREAITLYLENDPSSVLNLTQLISLAGEFVEKNYALAEIGMNYYAMMLAHEYKH